MPTIEVVSGPPGVGCGGTPVGAPGGAFGPLGPRLLVLLLLLLELLFMLLLFEVVCVLEGSVLSAPGAVPERISKLVRISRVWLWYSQHKSAADTDGLGYF